ncbi:MAG: energy-coupling factor ABC transporter ATP-binding protein [Ruminococcus sp.]|nr:energy-coupling factor ABC transporter ATP-binding protein [Ruminococcus sp.]
MIRLKGVDFHYGGENGSGDGVDGIDLTIADGECVVLCGRSGCGKTTLTRLINGLIPHFYEGELIGDVMIDDYNVSKGELSETSRRVGSVFQNPKSQFFNIDTSGELVFGCENLGLSHEEIGKRVERTVTDLKLRPLMDRNIFELSGGQKQRIAFARAILKDAPIIILDEATAFVDAENERKMRRAIEQITNGKTVIVIAHKLSSIKNADKILLLDHGRIAAEGTHEALTASCGKYRKLWAISEETQSWTLKEAGR